VESPVTNLVKGLLLVLIGMSEAPHTLREDVETMHLRVGYGLVVIGLFSVFDTPPHFIEEVEPSERYVEPWKTKAPLAPGRRDRPRPR
jgi:hypothetical protein